MDTVFDFFAEQPDFTEVAQVSTYRLWGPGGQIKVKVNDFGEASGEERYLAYARYADSEGRPRIVGNTYGASLGKPAGTVAGALTSINWNVFQEIDQS